MKRGGPIGRDPDKARQWQQRGAQSARNSRGGNDRVLGVRKAEPRRDDSAWRADCLARRGRLCRAAVLGGCGGGLQVDHVWPRSQGGPSVIANGGVLCRAHHEAKTAGRLRWRREWLDPDQVAFLSGSGWVEWQSDGEPRGRGWRHFERTAGDGGDDGRGPEGRGDGGAGAGGAGWVG